MTKQELNQYLINNDLKIMNLYYKRDRQGNIILDKNGKPINEYFQATTCMMNIGEGWYQLIHDLLEELFKTNWDKDIKQIKEKFGGLSFYIGKGNKKISNIISRYEELSYDTCEICGEKGKLRNDLPWWKTLCDKHYQEKLNKND